MPQAFVSANWTGAGRPCSGRARAFALSISLLAALSVGAALAYRPQPGPQPAPVDDEYLVVTVGPGGRDLRFSGDFLEGAAERVRVALAEHPGIARIHLTSDGGLVDESRAVGDLIAARGLVTYVPDVCVSACTLAFVRGRERILMEGARLGFHAPFETDDDGREVQVDGIEEERAYLAAGIAPDFAHQAIGTPSAQIWVPTADRLLAARVVTAVVDGSRLPDSTLDDEPTLAGARRAILRNFPALQAMAASVPGIVEEAAAWYLDGYRRGRPEREAVDALRAHADRVATALASAEAAVRPARLPVATVADRPRREALALPRN